MTTCVLIPIYSGTDPGVKEERERRVWDDFLDARGRHEKMEELFFCIAKIFGLVGFSSVVSLSSWRPSHAVVGSFTLSNAGGERLGGCTIMGGSGAQSLFGIISILFLSLSTLRRSVFQNLS